MVLNIDMFCGEQRKERDELSDASIASYQEVIECDYDTQCTRLYKLIEEKKWNDVSYFLENGKYSDASIFTSLLSKEPDPPAIQTRTWVTALDGTGNVRWCQLPLHAAITFHAPFSVISKLVEIYPKSVRCADDQDMLPLHYAFRFGAEDDVMAFLLERFPQAIGKRAVKDRLPLDMAQYGPEQERGIIIEYYVENAIRGAKAEWDTEYEKFVTSTRTEADSNLAKEILAKKKELKDAEKELSDAKKEIEFLRRELSSIEKGGYRKRGISKGRNKKNSKSIMNRKKKDSSYSSLDDAVSADQRRANTEEERDPVEEERPTNAFIGFFGKRSRSRAAV